MVFIWSASSSGAAASAVDPIVTPLEHTLSSSHDVDDNEGNPKFDPWRRYFLVTVVGVVKAESFESKNKSAVSAASASAAAASGVSQKGGSTTTTSTPHQKRRQKRQEEAEKVVIVIVVVSSCYCYYSYCSINDHT